MVYKNLINRFIISTLLFVIYLISVSNNYLLIGVVSIIYLIILYEIIISFKKLQFFLISYFILSYLSFVMFYLQFFDFFLFNVLVFSVIFFDSFSYFIGKLFGKNYIFKKISPKKTSEGYFGGIFLTNIIFVVYHYHFIIDSSYYSLLILINLIIFSSILGDLFQSFFKRVNKIKDSSSFLPGHGGFFDRFDSFMSAIIFLFFYSLFL